MAKAPTDGKKPANSAKPKRARKPAAPKAAAAEAVEEKPAKPAATKRTAKAATTATNPPAKKPAAKKPAAKKTAPKTAAAKAPAKPKTAKPKTTAAPKAPVPVAKTTMPEIISPPDPDEIGLAWGESPVDLPLEAPELHQPLRWASVAMATAAAFLVLTNATAIRDWGHELTPSKWTAPVIAQTESWYTTVDKAGLNAPVQAMRKQWKALQAWTFGSDEKPEQEPAPAE